MNFKKIFRAAYYKAVLKPFASLLRKDKDARHFLFSRALKTETEEYIENTYLRGYQHIESAVSLLKTLCIQKTTTFGIILDVGGADGTTAALFRELLPVYTIYVFEPTTEQFSILEKRFKGDENVLLFKKGVGSRNASLPFHKTTILSTSSFYELNTEGSGKFFSGNLTETGTEEVDVITLDSLCPFNEAIAILKADIQGYELEMLKGATETLKKTLVVILEVNNHTHYRKAPAYHEIDTFMRDSGFELYDLFPGTREEGKLKEWDVIYVNTNLLPA
jgi:FkbM family methyltransferase